MEKSSLFKPKRSKRKELPSPFPVPVEYLSFGNASWPNFEGKFNGSCVEISNSEAIDQLYFQGYFGKGNLSRSEPQFKPNEDVREILHLSLEEAYFLSYSLGCLQVIDQDPHGMDLDEMWTLYSKTKSNFLPCYVAYHHYRSCGWVVRSGIKFGCDFLLYKYGPDFFHASYSVRVIPVKNKTCDVSHSWIDFSGIGRITESAAKELVFCYVSFPSSSVDLGSPACLKDFEVNEITWKRWVASHERETGSEIMQL